MKKILLLVAIVATSFYGYTQSIDQKVEALLKQMTLEEKAGQMTQISVEAFLKTTNGVLNEPHEFDMAKLEMAIKKYKVGSILNVGGNAQTVEVWRKRIETIQQLALQERLKIPVLYGIDAIRGNNYTLNSVMFPQQIAQAASFNPAMAKKAAAVTAYETRASFIPWNFSPVLDLGRQPVWPRIWETYGEDPYLVAEMGKAVIQGYQGDALVTDKYHVAACLKHYLGYSMPLSGHDRTPAWIPERELREYFLPQFAAAVKAGAKSVMVNSAEINGLPVHANKHILTDILKGELGFKGLVVSDWQDIQYLYQRHRIAKDNKEAVMIAINAGIDMSMVPTDFTFTEALIALAKEGKIPMTRIDDAVRRILKVKYETGLFEMPVGNAKDYPLFNSAAHNQLNYDLTAECITLLKNTNNILPLSVGKKILVAGPSANSMRSLNGGWSRIWQGITSDETEKDKNTILEAMRNVFGAGNVEYSAGADFDKTLDVKDAVAKAANVDVIVLCIGETSYTETPGNIGDIRISDAQIELAKALAATGKPIVYVLTEGRPRIISAIEPLSAAVIHAYLAGNEGGNVIADVLAGKINPSGKLPYTYPRSTNSLVNYYHKYTETLQFDETAGYNPQWEFGFGLSYTQFAYSNLKLSSEVLSAATKTITVSVDVTNSGKVTGKEAVLLYVSDEVASITPEVKRLRGFEKIELKPGETKTVKFAIDKDRLSFINWQLQRVTEAGDFTVSVGGLKAGFKYE
ncbi:glycoside hydrolase family 3 N-terminal domain-containing protein [Chitinophaga sancti]|uniref:beta-glucosidase n=1 Tax=Chitinophaga sancti TaxID=1004 RepID=A0A1K1SM47_9BACT|nr:glycoside hydrolase family 3 N-terminal domain-containing protein [Chitinophaga sancti]WQD63908.1 glycoside hydrolase family 3 N-terminal domain-containing protein [Chitinophaga sancti]WQG90467.1 glycoside hydrolase family 3 N-terminal domain-containing protein [Chitinophaga sancti]SFW85366.1 beta-glucosidase [Chitinophaga sancti]